MDLVLKQSVLVPVISSRVVYNLLWDGGYLKCSVCPSISSLIMSAIEVHKKIHDIDLAKSENGPNGHHLRW